MNPMGMSEDFQNVINLPKNKQPQKTKTKFQQHKGPMDPKKGDNRWPPPKKKIRHQDAIESIDKT